MFNRSNSDKKIPVDGNCWTHVDSCMAERENPYEHTKVFPVSFENTVDRFFVKKYNKICIGFIIVFLCFSWKSRKTASFPDVSLSLRKLGSRDGAMVRALASHQCGLGSICCWFSTLLREVFLRVLRFSPLFKN